MLKKYQINGLMDHLKINKAFIASQCSNDIEDFCSEYPEGDAGRRQDLEPCYIRNGGIYSMKRDTLMNEKTRHGKVSRPYIMEDKYSINIDNEMDLRLAEVMLNIKEAIERS